MQDNFQFEKNTDTQKWQIRIIKPLSANELKQTDILSIMKAEENNQPKDSSVLVLHLPQEKSSDTLIFKKQYYITKYLKSGRGPLEFDTPIEFENLNDPIQAEMKLDSKLKFKQIKYLLLLMFDTIFRIF